MFNCIACSCYLWVCLGLIFILDRLNACTSCIGFYQYGVMISLSCMLVLQIHWVLGKCLTERLAVVEVHRDKLRVAELLKVNVWIEGLHWKKLSDFPTEVCCFETYEYYISVCYELRFKQKFFIPYYTIFLIYFLINRKRREEKETKLYCEFQSFYHQPFKARSNNVRKNSSSYCLC